jgi:hypothetical protein
VDYKLQINYQSEQTNVLIPNVQPSGSPKSDKPNNTKGRIIYTTIQLSDVQGFDRGSFFLTADDFTRTTDLCDVYLGGNAGGFTVNSLTHTPNITDMKINIPNTTPSGNYSVTINALVNPPQYSSNQAIMRSSTYSFSVP